MTAAIEGLLRDLAPQVLGVLTRRYGQFDLCEDATQEALLQAALKWPGEGTPVNPKGWLVTVGSRRLIDQMRSEHSRREREVSDYLTTPQAALVSDVDDSLALLFLCCHPDLSVPSQIALTLRAVGGLSTAQIAAAFLVPETTMAQRISRAKAAIKDSGASFKSPGGSPPTVMHVLYLIFNEGYTASSGEELTAPHLSLEAIRLTRMLHAKLPADSEVTGLLALMLLTEARRKARTAADGSLIPLSEQDRTLWDQDLIAEGTELVGATLPKGNPGGYQVQAAIAAIHCEPGETDWPQILALYGILERLTPGPMVTLNKSVAVAKVHGPQAGLDLLGTIEGLDRHHRLLSTRAHLHDLAGNTAEAARDFKEAARRTTSLPERRYLLRKLQA